MNVQLQWMDEAAMKKELEFKKELIRVFSLEMVSDKTCDMLALQDKMKEETLDKFVAECFFASDEELDVEKCARMISDYEVELLEAVSQEPDLYLKLAIAEVSIAKEKGEALKKFGPEYANALQWLWARELLEVEKQLGPKMFLFKAVQPRAGRIVAEAKKLQGIDVEAWEQWRGMPSLYRLNEVDI